VALAALPSGVTGPVERAALARLARRRFWEICMIMSGRIGSAVLGIRVAGDWAGFGVS
jgi:hypothetical protein